MSTSTTPLSFRLLKRIAFATLEEAQGDLQAAPTPGRLGEDLRPAVEQLSWNTEDLAAKWQEVQDALRDGCVSLVWLGRQVPAARSALIASRELLVWLQQNTDGFADRLNASASALDCIEGQLVPLEELLARPEPAPNCAAIDRGLGEMERGEGEDSDAFLTRFLQTGQLEP